MTTEHEMIAAHKLGIECYHVNGTGIYVDQVRKEARKRFSDKDLQDSFIAGYLGARRRAAEQK